MLVQLIALRRRIHFYMILDLILSMHIELELMVLKKEKDILKLRELLFRAWQDIPFSVICFKLKIDIMEIFYLIVKDM
jgi:hypothetical protein